MSNFSNIPTGLKITSQIPLNSKEWVKDEATLAYLGVDDNLAFTYHDQLEVFCLAEKKLYIWREVQEGEENTGLVPLDFTYPLLLPSTYDVNYSGKTYNFFLKEYVTIDNIQDLIQIRNVGTGAGVYKDTTGLVHNFKTLISSNSSVIITENATTIDLKSTEGGTSINLQRIISTDYILSDVDDKHTIFIDNGSDKVFITIPLGLKPNFFCVFLQQGTGEVLFINEKTIIITIAGTPREIKFGSLR